MSTAAAERDEPAKMTPEEVLDCRHWSRAKVTIDDYQPCPECDAMPRVAVDVVISGVPPEALDNNQPGIESEHETTSHQKNPPRNHHSRFGS